MPITTGHRFISAIPDGSDSTQVRTQSNWNDSHPLSGGSTGQVLVYDTALTDHLNGIAPGASGLPLISQGAGVLPIFGGPISVAGGGTGLTALTTGSIVFSGAGILAQDNANFFWDSANHRLGIGTTTFGATGTQVIALGVGTAPTTAPASIMQLWSANRNGANTASLFARTEDSGINESLVAMTIQAFDGTERTTTAGPVDLSTLTVNIPPLDAFIITGLVRKSAGAAASVSIGLKVNTVQTIANFAVTTANNAVEFGSFSFGLSSTVTGATMAGSFGASRDTNYTQGPGMVATTNTSGGAMISYANNTYAAQLPTAAITAIAITGSSANALVTCAIKNITVYRIARA